MQAIFDFIVEHLQQLVVGMFLFSLVGIAIQWRQAIWELIEFVSGFILYKVGKRLKHRAAASFSLRKYCKKVLSDSKIQFVVVPTPTLEEILLNVDEIFVPLMLEHQGKPVRYNELLSSNISRMRIVGDAGSGKSTIMKRLIRDECHRGQKKPSGARLPIWIELKELQIPDEFAESPGDWLYGYLRGHVIGFESYRMADCFESFATQSGLAVLLDGLDEVSSTKYKALRDAILGLSDKLTTLSENNLIVITMRTQFNFLTRDEFASRFPMAYLIQPFSPTELYEFLSRWSNARSRSIEAGRIFRDLTDRPTLREMCSNPLVLSMYVERGSRPSPETRTEFYKQVTDELLIFRRHRQRPGEEISLMKVKEDRERILGTLAFNHLLDTNQPANSLPWSSVIQTIVDFFECDEQAALDKFNEIANDTGLVTNERRMESVRFVHLTFCEYLAANEAVGGQQNGWEMLIDSHKTALTEEDSQLRSRLLEVIPFATRLSLPKDRSVRFEDVIELQDDELLRRTFLETKLYDHKRWGEFVTSERERLLSVSDEHLNSDWLRSLHLFNVLVSDAKLAALHDTKIQVSVDLPSFYEALLDRGIDSLRLILSEYAKQDAAAAFRLTEVAKLDLVGDFPEIVVNNCDQPAFFALIKQAAEQETSKERITLWCTLLAISGIKSKFVAHRMLQIPPVEAWKSLSKTRHLLNFIVPNSIYRQVLVITLNIDGVQSLEKEMGVPETLDLLRQSISRELFKPIGPELFGSVISRFFKTTSFEFFGFKRSMIVWAGLLKIVKFRRTLLFTFTLFVYIVYNSFLILSLIVPRLFSVPLILMVVGLDLWSGALIMLVIERNLLRIRNSLNLDKEYLTNN